MSTVRVNTVDKRTGSTLTLGGCGTTVTLGAGATQTGFGQTYSAVEYCTTAKTSPFTAAAGTGYFINTTCGAVTVTLPASPTAGDVVAFKDYASQWNTNAVTLCNNGNKINGVCATANLNTQNQSVSLIYVDATKGWQDIQDSTAGVTGASYITATGGTITTSGNYKIHTFTSDGCFSVSSIASSPANNVVDYLVVAGGGSGGTANGGFGAGAGGAGGFRLSNSTCMTAPLTSPLASPTGLPVSATTYPITVGGGGAGFSSPCVSNGNVGSNSVFSTITSTGGGYGAGGTVPNTSVGGNGGSGGGGWSSNCSIGGGGGGNTPPTSPPQGFAGGDGGPGPAYGGGGGGGAGGLGGNTSPGCVGGIGGVGSYVIGTGLAGCNGTPGPVCGAKYFSGGGGGASGTGSPGGTGGGGKGGDGGSDPGGNGTTNTGGGGGGTRAGTSGAGGSGIVIIRYKYQ